MLKIDRNKILLLQAKQCLTNSKLSAKADISRQTLANIMTQKTKGSLVTIGCIAKALGVEIEEIIEGSEKKC